MNIFGGVNSARLSVSATSRRRRRRCSAIVCYDNQYFHRVAITFEGTVKRDRSKRYRRVSSRRYVRLRRYMSRGIET